MGARRAPPIRSAWKSWEAAIATRDTDVGTNRETIHCALLFADMEGSTQLLKRIGPAYPSVLERYQELIGSIVTGCDGTTVTTEGDGYFATLPSSIAAVRAALSIAAALRDEPWPLDETVRARIGIHSGDIVPSPAGPIGLDIHRAARLGAAGHGGQILATGAVVDECRVLDDVEFVDLGMHRFKDLDIPEHVYQVVPDGTTVSFPPIRSLPAEHTNLPLQTTSFVGRDADLESVIPLLTDTRLLTLTGPGGAGKTRLAVQAASRVLTDYPDGVWLVELAPISDPDLVASRVAAAAGADTGGGDATAALVDHLRERTVLLLLDNCEHLVSAAATLANTLLTTCRRVRVVATSRIPLQVPGEQLWEVGPIADPEDAARLFVERVRGSVPGFAFDAASLSSVRRICDRLDRLPLAIELAAVRVRTLGLADLENRLEDRFSLLTGGAVTDVVHHRTLQATVDWSYDLLTEVEQRCLSRLAVFRGPFDLKAAEDVCTGPGVEARLILDAVDHLVMVSLVAVQSGGRFRLLETIRDYAMSRLQDSGDVAAAAQRHFDHFRLLAGDGGDGMSGEELADWLTSLARDHDNFTAAVQFALESGDRPAAVGLTGALGRYWYRRGHLAEGLTLLQRALAGWHDPPELDTARALRFAGGLAAEAGELDLAESFLEREEVVSRKIGRPLLVARSLNAAAGVAWRRLQLRRAASLYEEALALPTIDADPFSFRLLTNLTTVLLAAGDVDGARVARRRQDEAGRRFEPPDGGPIVDHTRGVMAYAEGRLDDSIAALERARTRLESSSFAPMVAKIDQDLATTHLAAGNIRSAFEAAERSHREYHDQGARANTARSLALMATAHHRLGNTPAAGAEIREALELAIRGSHTEEIIVASLYLGEIAADRMPASVAAVVAFIDQALSSVDFVLAPHDATGLDRLREAAGTPRAPVPSLSDLLHLARQIDEAAHAGQATASP